MDEEKKRIIKKEYDQIIDLWKFEHKWLDKMPFDDSCYDEMVDECNKTVKEKPESEQRFLVILLTEYLDHMAEINKRLEALKNDKG